MPEIVYFSFLLSRCCFLLCPLHSCYLATQNFSRSSSRRFSYWLAYCMVGVKMFYFQLHCLHYIYPFTVHILFVDKFPLHYISYKRGDVSASDSVHTLSVNKLPQHYIFPLIYFPIKSYPLTGPAMISDSDSFSYYQLTRILYTF